MSQASFRRFLMLSSSSLAYIRRQVVLQLCYRKGSSFELPSVIYDLKAGNAYSLPSMASGICLSRQLIESAYLANLELQAT